MRAFLICGSLTLFACASLSAQTGGAGTLPAEQQVAAAVQPLPQEFRDSATVLGYDGGGRLVTLREGGGAFICLASDPKGERFHVACYHRTLEPFMARGRALRAQGTTGDQVDSVRFAEVKSGKLRMPAQPASLYSLTGPPGSYDPATNRVTGARSLFVVYIPGATANSTGLSARPQQGVPWIMFPGTPKAHIMFVPSM
ncbi:MAG TPA: hypothetical protein VJ596_05085 [Gemmatimonadaceae bacterium]|nr:hypothetical protein [Gemmatimonadaceae bacterium]